MSVVECFEHGVGGRFRDVGGVPVGYVLRGERPVTFEQGDEGVRGGVGRLGVGLRVPVVDAGGDGAP
ncbi:hypothetical protein P0W64_04390 [Tsukamurella sp. 8F]|uniref:hypothetical protein n=1 Tax=unclassified Tsukamurella TaxID=2633480 RepID=UPI0023B9791C|nr:MULTISPECIES: hypothetical protein [unclassified Tsukamurella]MDF0529727.1 hypothetical protein [Tsukamurella sp. 8J]MDF0586012.1 hypothetical protein [Tsukamurella sp. 8F]